MRPSVVTSTTLLASPRRRFTTHVPSFTTELAANTAVSLGRGTVGIWIAILIAEGDCHSAGAGATEMDTNYMFLCGVMWCQFGQQEAAKELLRVANSGNPDMSALAWAMLKKGAHRLRDLERLAQPSSSTQWLRAEAQI
jgi:hypothetical protein